VPFVAGDSEFYNLVSNGDPHYPSRRWEFDETMEALLRLPDVRGDLIDCGAGDGAFLSLLSSSPLCARFQLHASEFDVGALRRLRGAGVAASAESITELSHASRGPFAVICMFQALEHSDDPHGVFDAFVRLGGPGGHIFVSVPNAAAIDRQERVTHFWDMPPNHVSRWTVLNFMQLADLHGIELIDWRIEPSCWILHAWRLAVAGINSRAYNVRSMAGAANRVNSRVARGLLKRFLAIPVFLRLLLGNRTVEGDSLWVHMRIPG
jgi:hypothetical protein